MNLGALLNRLRELEDRLSSIEHLRNIEVTLPLTKDENKSGDGSLVIGLQEPITEETEFWARIDDYDAGTGFYGWVEAVPTGDGTFEDNESSGLLGTVDKNPLYQANGLVLGVDSHARIKRAYYDEGYQWVYVTDTAPMGITSINSQTGPAITLAAGPNITITPTSTNVLTIEATGGGSGLTSLTSLNGQTGPAVRLGLGRSGTGPNIGAVAAWNSAVAYQAGDLVSASGSNYYCILAHTAHSPPNATYWTLTTEDLIVANVPDASDVGRGLVSLTNQSIGSGIAVKGLVDQVIIVGHSSLGSGIIFNPVKGYTDGQTGSLVKSGQWWEQAVSYNGEFVAGATSLYGMLFYSGGITTVSGELIASAGVNFGFIATDPVFTTLSINHSGQFWNAGGNGVLYSGGYVYSAKGYCAPAIAPGAFTGSQPVKAGWWATVAGLEFYGGILGGGTFAVSGSSIVAGSLPTTVLAPSFYLPAANAGTVIESENKSGSTVAAGIVVTTHSSGTGFVLADSTDIAKSGIGITRESIANTVSGEVQSEGLVVLADWTASTGSATLMAKATYFSDPANPGKMTTTVPTATGQVVQVVGTAVSTDTLDLVLSSPILL